MTASAASPLTGRRLADDFDARNAEAGDYWFATWHKRDGGRELWFRDPFGHPGRVSTHTVEEHDDGTVTVMPSIYDTDPGGFHGWLTKGVWTW